MNQFHIRVANDILVFSAGHFITLEGGTCEPLHGHTYHVAAELSGPLDENHYVFDFVALGNALRTIVGELDHRLLLPTRHPTIHVGPSASQIEVTFADRHWSFPASDCVLLPVANTTTELLAQYIGERLLAKLPGLRTLRSLQIEVGEGTGASAVCKLDCHPA